METVGIRELKNHLSAYVRKAEAGDVVLVTDRGRVVAELVPPGWESSRPTFDWGSLSSYDGTGCACRRDRMTRSCTAAQVLPWTSAD